ncbi:MAG: tetratricopeptide repeat protein [Tannerellaceae bacterium]|nr:tetratricopeptide repeat protein [Tannerellaceae bacterium]
MKKIISLLLFSILFVNSIWAQDAIIKEAEEAYQQENYTQAIELYQQILTMYGESAEIYYNLGNAHYKAGHIAPSILNYERALLLDPGDADIRFNLQMAKQRAVDKIEPVPEFFLAKWFHTLQDMAAADSWGKMGIICFILFIGCLVLFFFSKWIHLKKIGFYLGLVFLLVVIFANIFAYNQKNELVYRDTAIIFAPTVTIKSSPDVSGTDLFILHEGTKVFVKSTLGSWFEIELEDGNVGWIQSKDIELI